MREKVKEAFLILLTPNRFHIGWLFISTDFCNSVWNITVWSKSRHQQQHDPGCFLTHCCHCLFPPLTRLLMNKPKVSIHNVKTATIYWEQTSSAPFRISRPKKTLVPGIRQPLLPSTTETVHKHKHGVSFHKQQQK